MGWVSRSVRGRQADFGMTASLEVGRGPAGIRKLRLCGFLKGSNGRRRGADAPNLVELDADRQEGGMPSGEVSANRARAGVLVSRCLKVQRGAAMITGGTVFVRGARVDCGCELDEQNQRYAEITQDDIRRE
jgi:hypothetical protein